MKRDWADRRYRRLMLALPVVYFLFYLLCFVLLEEHVRPRYWISSRLDAYIPFCEWFILPYAAWFPLVPGLFLYFYRRDPERYRYLCRAILLGLTACLVLYALFPNGQLLRRAVPRDNLLCQLVTLLRRVDTPTNVCPSIHVFVSVTLAIAMARSPALARHQRLRAALMILCGLICLATVFLKQHSVIDVACGGALSAAMDLLASPGRVSGMFQRLRRKKKKPALES